MLFDCLKSHIFSCVGILLCRMCVCQRLRIHSVEASPARAGSLEDFWLIYSAGFRQLSLGHRF